MRIQQGVQFGFNLLAKRLFISKAKHKTYFCHNGDRHKSPNRKLKLYKNMQTKLWNKTLFIYLAGLGLCPYTVSKDCVCTAR